MLDLRTKRLIARLNQYDLAIRSGIPQPTCSLMENGYRVPNKNERRALARALGCNVDEIDWERPYAQRMAQS